MQVQLNDRIWNKDVIQSTLTADNPQFVARALMAIYARQTTDEQQTRDTKHVNARGFNSRDAGWLSKIAEKWKRYERWYDDAQCDRVGRALRKYHRQLLEEIANKPGAVVLDARHASEIEMDRLVQDAERQEDIRVAEQRVRRDHPMRGAFA